MAAKLLDLEGNLLAEVTAELFIETEGPDSSDPAGLRDSADPPPPGTYLKTFTEGKLIGADGFVGWFVLELEADCSLKSTLSPRANSGLSTNSVRWIG